MNKYLILLLIGSIVSSVGSYKFNGSTISAITLVGGVIKTQHSNIDKKYKRKDCPVCKGLGWYISGDKITKVDCGYCELEKTGESPKITIKDPVCKTGTCSFRK